MHPRIILSVGNFFFATFSTLVTLILLPYLSQFMPAAYAGLVVAGSALCSVILFPFMPWIVKRYGVQQVALMLAFSEMLVLFGLAAVPGALVGILFIIIAIGLQPFLSYEFDLLLEATIADNNTTSRVRAVFRSAWNIAALAAPLLLGALLANSDSYGRVFIAAAAMLVPIIVFFTLRRLPEGPAPRFEHMKNTLIRIFHSRDLAAVTLANLILYLFFVWMPLYTPIYLHEVLGIPWPTLGWIFSLMLMPYVLIGYPAGFIADKFLGDRELMVAGFIIAGGATVAFGLIGSSAPLVIIGAILIVSRIGSALVETMVDGHFFRRLARRDINSVSVFRGVWPLSYIIGPLVGSIILLYGTYSHLFLITGGFVALAGAATALLIRDFR